MELTSISSVYERIEQNFNDHQYTKVLELLDPIIEQAKQANERLIVAKLYDLKINCYKYLALLDRAHQTLTEFHEFIELFGTLESTISFHLTAISLWENGSVAIDDIVARHISKLSSYVFQTDDPNLKRRIFGTIATHYMNVQQFEKAVNYLELAFLYAQIQVEQEPSRWILKYSTIIDLVYLNTKLGKMEVAKRVNAVIYPHIDKLTGYQKGLVLQNSGYLLMLQGQYNEAITEFEKLLEHTNHYHDTSLKAIAYQYICNCMEQINHPQLVEMLKKQIATLNDLLDESQAELALQAEAKIQENTFFKKSSIDSLTNVYTRSYFVEQAASLLKNHQENKLYTLGIIDVDYFKQINDVYGHLTGDAALQKIGDYLQKFMLSHNTLACRYGGDEFIVLFNADSIEALDAMARQLFREMKTLQLDVGTSKFIDLSFSIGFVHLLDYTTLDDAIDKADSALYVVKRAGRNNFAFYDEYVHI